MIRLLCCATLLIGIVMGADRTLLRPPAVPLVACDPYFSIWSQADRLTDVDTTHWTGKPNRLACAARIDGKTFRVLGGDRTIGVALKQTSVTVLPTRTICAFDDAGIALSLTFMTPALPDDLDVLARPVTYVNFEIRSTDGKEHDLALSFDASGELAVDTPRQDVEGEREAHGELTALKLGAKEQLVLTRKGDDIRIEWGYLYLAAPTAEVANAQVAELAKIRGNTPAADWKLPAPGGSVVASLALKPIKVSAQPTTQWLMLAYDDLYSIQYMKQNLRPYWRRSGWEAADLLKASAKDFDSLRARCAKFDDEFMADLTKAGGEKYAKIGALAFRQCFAAGKFVADANGKPLSFCKENHSNGCIATSDVFYPMAPQFLLSGPTIAKSFVVPFMNYAASPRWKFPFAPHDLGTYPKANGQVYGGGERTEVNQMPVEESSNLLILIAAIAQMENNADFATLYWPQLQRWAEYLKEKGFDPENQLCTDDFAGHLAHNVNLSAKAICGLGSFAKLCAMRGDQAKSDEYFKLAREFALRWVKEAEDGDHFRLAYDRPGTWSQKYNLVWDRVLGLNLFPADVLKKELAYYRKIQNTYALPLDNRKTYTKLDWTLWTAALTQDRGDFEALVAPVFDFLNETPDRSPMTDWYETKSARKVGFTARPVVGGVFMQLLYDKALWQKYASRDNTKASGWAPMPNPAATAYKTIVPNAKDDDKIKWEYTTAKPADNWFQADFKPNGWKEGVAGFGALNPPGSVVRTNWSTDDIWLRREFTLAENPSGELTLTLHHDEDAQIYINGVLATTVAGFIEEYEHVPINPKAAQALHAGRNTFAVHCHQTRGGQYIDVGIAAEVKK